MANGPSPFDPQAKLLQLDERLTNFSGRVSHLEQKVDSGFAQAAAATAALGVEMRAAIGTLGNDLRGAQQTKWQLIWPAVGVALSFCVVIGGLAYWPIREDQQQLGERLRELATIVSTVVQDLPERFIPRRETERLSARATEDRARVDRDIAAMREELVPRREHELNWMAQRNRDAEIQRQIDQIRNDFGDVYSSRDVILDLKEQVDQLWRERMGTPTGASR